MDLVLSFPDEHSRILRALHDSLDRESDAQRLLRRMKESLVTTALKLQVAVKTVEDDEITIQQLRKELEEMRRDAKNAGKSAEEATKVIGDLRIEVAGLKRRLNNLEQAQQQQEALEKSALKLKSGSDDNNRPKSKRKSNNNNKDKDESNNRFNDFTRPPPGHVCDDQVNSMFNDARKNDGGFALDARLYLDELQDIQSNDNIENSEYLKVADSVQNALIELRNMEKNIGMNIGTGSGLGSHESPMGLQGHPHELKAVKNKSVLNNNNSNSLAGADTNDMFSALFNATTTLARRVHEDHVNENIETATPNTTIDPSNTSERITTDTTVLPSLPSIDATTNNNNTNTNNTVPTTTSITTKTNLYSQNGGSVLNAPPTYEESINHSSNYGGATQGDITSFQQWKMSNFLWAPDTPEASKGADHWAVERLTDNSLRTALQEVGDQIRRPVLGNVTKVNEISLSKARAPPKIVLGPLGLPIWPPTTNNNSNGTPKSKSPMKKTNKSTLPTMKESSSSSGSRRDLKSRGKSRNGNETNSNTTNDNNTSGGGHRMTVAEIQEELEGNKKIPPPSEPEETIII